MIALAHLFLPGCGGGGPSAGLTTDGVSGSLDSPGDTPDDTAQDAPFAWGSPQRVQTPGASPNRAYGPLGLTIDSSGNAFVVWSEYLEIQDTKHLWANRYSSNPGWGEAQRIQRPDGHWAHGASVAVDSSGNAVVVWEEDEWSAARKHIWSCRWSADGGWSSPVPLESVGGQDSEIHGLEMDGSGNALVLWQQYPFPNDGSPFDLWASRYQAAGAWGPAERVEDLDANVSDGQLAVDASGSALAAWRQDGKVWANWFVPATGWASPKRIDQNDGGEALGTIRAVTDPAGRAIVVWWQAERIWYNRYLPDQGWGEAQPTAEDARGYPELASDGSGNAIAVWCQRGEDNVDSLWANRYDSDDGWAGPVLLEAHDGNASSPSVTFDRNGDALVLWERKGGDGEWGLWATTYDRANGWGTAGEIAGNARSVRMAADSSGNVTLAWGEPREDRVTPHRHVWAARYEVGSGWGTAQMLDTRENDADGALVAAAPSGKAVVVWQQDGEIWARVSN